MASEICCNSRTEVYVVNKNQKTCYPFFKYYYTKKYLKLC